MANPFKFLGSRSRSSTIRQDLCETCGKFPKFVENGVAHPYCSRTCAKAQRPTCKRPNCTKSGKPAFNGFCSPRHERDTVQVGQSTPCHRCGKQPQVIDGLCIQCNGDTKSRLREMDPRDPKRISLVASVEKRWKGVGRVQVHKVYEIFLPNEIYADREAYRKNLEALGKTSKRLTFHGAQCICNLGVADPSLCDWNSCGICSIIKSSFTAFEFGEKYNSGRYEQGIYSYFDPSMADGFATSSTSSPYRAILGCEVNVPAANSNASESPLVAGSVEDKVRMVVSSAKAIIPKFVILYSKET